MKKSDLVVKSNRLNTAIQNLSLSEVRIIQLAIVDSRETGNGLATDKPLLISAARYAEVFDVSRQTATEAILTAEKNLFERRFSFLDDQDKVVKSRWVQRVRYLGDEAGIEVMLTYDVVNEITRINGYETFFTKYLIEQTAMLQSRYSVRLYELLTQWKTAKNTPLFDLECFRQQMGLDADEYTVMSDFKKRVLQLAVDEINEKSDLKISYEQVKKGRKITGFKFKISEKSKTKTKNPVAVDKDSDTLDAITSMKMTDKQRGTFAAKLSRMSDLSSRGKQGENYQEFASRIEIELMDESKQAFYLPYLKKLGFQLPTTTTKGTL